MKIIHTNTSTPIFGMSNMIGRYVKLDGPLDISFYFGSKHAGVPVGGEIPHGIRVKISPNKEKFVTSDSCYMELHGDYDVKPENVLSGRLLKIARDFFKKYKVLFAGAWEEEIIEDDITAYLRGRIDLSELIQDMPLYDKYKDHLDDVTSISDFEQVVRANKIFNMHD